MQYSFDLLLRNSFPSAAAGDARNVSSMRFSVSFLNVFDASTTVHTPFVLRKYTRSPAVNSDAR